MITANEIKRRGVTAIEEALEDQDRVGITVRGKIKYLVMSVGEYEEIRLLDLNQALEEAKKDIADANYTVETAEEHVKRLWND